MPVNNIVCRERVRIQMNIYIVEYCVIKNDNLQTCTYVRMFVTVTGIITRTVLVHIVPYIRCAKKLRTYSSVFENRNKNENRRKNFQQNQIRYQLGTVIWYVHHYSKLYQKKNRRTVLLRYGTIVHNSTYVVLYVSI